MPHAGYHREQARRCREIAHGCDHELTREALEELADEYDTRAEWIDGGMVRPFPLATA
jgi:hypothetical protein